MRQVIDFWTTSIQGRHIARRHKEDVADVRLARTAHESRRAHRLDVVMASAPQPGRRRGVRPGFRTTHELTP